jgi:hypothetical protein
MKKFATVLFCVAFLFGGIAGCATTQQKPEAPVVVVPDKAPEVAVFEDAKFIKGKIRVNVTGCKGSVYKEYPYILHTIDSEGVERPTTLVALWDKDCSDYGFFLATKFGTQFIKKADTLESLRTMVLGKIKGKPVK